MPNPEPLEGKRVVVTRARAQADALSEKIHARGAVPIVYALIEIGPPSDFAPLDRAIQHVMQYDWVVFSSANGVRYFWSRMDDCQMRLPRIAAVGAQTAQALRQNGLRVDAMPAEFLARNIAAALGAVRDQKILLVRPEVAPAELRDSLRAQGAHVDEVAAYRTLAIEPQAPLALDAVDVITLASASAATSLGAHVQQIPPRVCVATIGPSTSEAARQAGVRVDVEAQVHTLDGLVAALAAYFAQESKR